MAVTTDQHMVTMNQRPMTMSIPVMANLRPTDLPGQSGFATASRAHQQTVAATGEILDSTCAACWYVCDMCTCACTCIYVYVCMECVKLEHIMKIISHPACLPSSPPKPCIKDQLVPLKFRKHRCKNGILWLSGCQYLSTPKAIPKSWSFFLLDVAKMT